MNLKSAVSQLAIPREIELYDNIVRAINKNENILIKSFDQQNSKSKDESKKQSISVKNYNTFQSQFQKEKKMRLEESLKLLNYKNQIEKKKENMEFEKNIEKDIQDALLVKLKQAEVSISDEQPSYLQNKSSIKQKIAFECSQSSSSEEEI